MSLGRSSILVLACLALGCISVPKVWITDERAIDLDGAQPGKLDIATDNGEIHVTAHPGANGIHVRARLRAGGRDDADAARCLAAIVIETPIENDTQVIRWHWSQPREPQWSAMVSFDVECQPRMAVTADSDNGALAVTGMQGPATLSTDNGGIRVIDHSGALAATTDNGAVDVAASCADLHLETHNGRITADLSGSGPLHGEVRSRNGAIRLTLGDRISTRLECRTHNGVVHAEHASLATTRSSRTELVATAGRGEGRLAVETDNGSITVK